MSVSRRIAIVSAAVVLAMVAITLGGGCTASSSDPGQLIFTRGEGHAGPIPRSNMGGAYTTRGLPCAGCHGASGQGTGVGPSITRATLGTAHTITHKPSATDPNPQPVTEGPWTALQTVAVVRSGVTPEGRHLGGRMPMWQLDAQDSAALAKYLSQL